MSLPEALRAWRESLGEDYVSDAPAACGAAATATYRTGQRVNAIIRPGDREEVQECLRIATRCATPVYPISGGKNWGYGSRVPVADGCVLIQLDRLNRILDFEERLAFLTVEPGVTFAQANRFLRERQSDLMLGQPGSTAEASIIGNAVERGIFSGLHGERASQVCAFEVVLPTGELLGVSVNRPVVAQGPGPSLDGLFLQSNLGIVTKLTHWLTPTPGFYQPFAFQLRRRERLPELIDTLQSLKRGQLVETNFSLLNEWKVLTYARPPGDRAALDGATWFGHAAITAPSEAIGALLRRLVEERLAPAVDRIEFKAPGAANPFVGPPAEMSLSTIYWPKKELPAELDPDRDGCGLMWLCPVAPFEGAALAHCVGLLEAGLAEHGFAPIISLQCHTLRAVHVVASISFDRDEPGQDERALVCHDAVLARLLEEGFIPYRLCTHAMLTSPSRSDARASLLRRLKGVVDPAGILAPGRYEW